jgi:hypothetical protein
MGWFENWFSLELQFKVLDLSTLKKKNLAIGMTKSPYGCSTCPESRDMTQQETQYHHEYIRLSYNADWIQKHHGQQCMNGWRPSELIGRRSGPQRTGIKALSIN